VKESSWTKSWATPLLHSIKYYAKGLYHYVDEDHCFLLSAGIAFNVLYCVLPLSLVVFYFFSAALTSQVAVTYVVNFITDSFPVPLYEADVRTWLATELTKISKGSGIAGLVGGIALFWLASVLFATLRTSLNAVLNMTSKSNILLQKLRDFVLMIVVLFLLLASTFISPIVTLVQHLGSQVLPGWLAYILDSTIPRFVSLGISIVLYVLLYRMLPHIRLSRKVIFVSAATAVVLTEAMRLLFVYYMTHVSSIGTLYGTYAFLIGISIWVYYASLAFLVGAEVGWLYKERHEIPLLANPLLFKEGAGGGAPLMPQEIVQVRHPGSSALEPAVLETYEDAKSNPAKPAGEIKPHPKSRSNP